MYKRIVVFFISVTLLSLGKLFAEKMQLSVNAPTSVVVDKPFQLVYSVNGKGKDFKMPTISNFEILAGPFESRVSRSQIVNGQASSYAVTSYTYTLQATKIGSFSIPSASIFVDGKRYASSPLQLKVISSEDKESKSKSSENTVPNNRVFIRTQISKSSVYEQEPILLTYKLFTLLDVSGMSDVKLPDFNGFMKQEINQNPNKQLSYETFNGKNYGTVVLYQVLLYPQQVGDIVIDKAKFDAEVRIENKSNVKSIFDDFFESYTDVTKKLIAPAVRINVKPLPANRPAGYNAFVGKLNLSATVSSKEIKADEAFTIKIVLSGVGNLKMIQNPLLSFPESFEVYEPKVTNEFKASDAGISGTRTIEYMVIPRSEGKFTIPSVKLSFFDTDIQAYKTLLTPVFNLDVTKGNVSTVNQSVVMDGRKNQELTSNSKDIRFIDRGETVLKQPETPLVREWYSWFYFLIPFFLTLLGFFVLKKKTHENADVVFMKNKVAGSKAFKGLAHARKFMKEEHSNAFYEEIFRVLWNYLGDKLNLQASALTKENLESVLISKSLSTELIYHLISLISEAEFIKYSPTSGFDRMEEMYKEVEKIISDLERDL